MSIDTEWHDVEEGFDGYEESMIVEVELYGYGLQEWFVDYITPESSEDGHQLYLVNKNGSEEEVQPHNDRIKRWRRQGKFVPKVGMDVVLIMYARPLFAAKISNVDRYEESGCFTTETEIGERHEDVSLGDCGAWWR